MAEEKYPRLFKCVCGNEFDVIVDGEGGVEIKSCGTDGGGYSISLYGTRIRELEAENAQLESEFKEGCGIIETLTAEKAELEAAETALKGVVEAQRKEIAELEQRIPLVDNKPKVDAMLNEITRLREALGAADKVNEVLNASSSGHFWADVADAQEEYIKARAKITALKGVWDE